MGSITVYESNGQRYQVETGPNGRIIEKRALPNLEEVVAEAPAVVNAAVQQRSLYELGLAVRNPNSSSDNPKSIW